MQSLHFIHDWYATNCDGEWEHNYGVRIETLDNPGWAVDIDLVDTALEAIPFEVMKIDRTDEDWLQCRVEHNVFRARGGARNLEEMLEIFVNWAAAHGVVVPM